MAIVVGSVMLCLGRFANHYFFSQNVGYKTEVALEVMSQIAAWVIALNVSTLKTFLRVYFLKLLVSLKVTTKLEKLLAT